MTKPKKARVVKPSPSIPPPPNPMVPSKADRISENKAEYYLRTVEIYFTRIDTNPLAQTAKLRLIDLIMRHNTFSSAIERNGLYKMIKHMQTATLVRERRWYRVPFLEYTEMRFFDRKNEDGTVSYRNMPLFKKNKAAQRRRVDRELAGLSSKQGQNDDNMVYLDRNNPKERHLLSLLG